MAKAAYSRTLLVTVSAMESLRVLVVGGTDPSVQRDGIETTEFFDPSRIEWTPGPPLRPAWAFSTATLLDTGKVLVFGGEAGGFDPVSTMLLFE